MANHKDYGLEQKYCPCPCLQAVDAQRMPRPLFWAGLHAGGATTSPSATHTGSGEAAEQEDGDVPTSDLHVGVGPMHIMGQRISKGAAQHWPVVVGGFSHLASAAKGC